MNTKDRAGLLSDIGLESIFLVSTKDMVFKLRSRIAYAAKLLSKVTGSNRTESIGVISKCLGFESHHDLSTNLSKLESFNGKIPDKSVLKPIKNSMFLIFVTDRDDPPEKNALEWYLNFANLISNVLGVSENRILDGVCAPLFGDKDWVSLTSRTSKNCTRNLYSFICDEFNNPDGSGFFKASFSCSELQGELDRLVDADSQKPRAYLKLDCERLSWCSEILRQQPNFVPASLEIAEYYEIQGQGRKSQIILNSAINYLESLIPPGFEGEILSLGENCLYYNVLKATIDNSCSMGYLNKAIRLTRKAIKLDTRDGFGFRYILPLILVIDGQKSQAVKESAFITYDGISEPEDFDSEEDFFECAFECEDGAIPNLIKSITSYAAGNNYEFYYHMAKSLLSEPYLISTVLDDPKRHYPGKTKYDWDNEVRSFGYSSYFFWAYSSLSGIGEVCLKFCNSQEFITASEDAFVNDKNRRGNSKTDGAEHHDDLIKRMSIELANSFSK